MSGGRDSAASSFQSLLRGSFGASMDVELFAGFLAAVGSALINRGSAQNQDLSRDELIAEFVDHPSVIVPIQPGVLRTALDVDVERALDAAISGAHSSNKERMPNLQSVLDGIADASRGLVIDLNGRPLSLRAISVRGPNHRLQFSLPQSWLAMRGLLADVALADSAVELREIVDATLDDPDWRARMTAVLVVGRFRLEPLARRSRAASVPPLEVGLRDDDRRSLLALRDIVADRAEGAVPERPVHPDAAIAALRAALVDDVRSAVSGSGLPGPSSRAHILKALVEPAMVIAEGTAPAEWHHWLTTDM